MQTLTSYVLSGFNRNSDCGPHRVQADGISFYETTGVFRFHSDLREGILLHGELLGFPATAALITPETEENLRKYQHLHTSDSLYSETLYIDEQRTEVHAESLQNEHGVQLIRVSIPLSTAEKVTPYLMELRLDTKGQEVTPEQIFSSPEFRHLLQRELFFPENARTNRKEPVS
jgi:hypothetical protein